MVLELGLGWLWQPGDGIVRLRLHDHVEMTLEDARELLAAYVLFDDGPPVLLLTDIGTAERGSTAAREHLAGDEGAKAHRAVAHIVPSAVARVLMTSWIRLQRPRYPTKVFSPAEVEEALSWLRSVPDNTSAT